MKRDIIRIDENLCNGCGRCIPGCPEGALQIIDNKARLVSDLFCDGLGACIGTCPQGAIAVESREAVPYDERRVMENIVRQGANTILAHLRHLDDHGEQGYLAQAVAFLQERGLPVPDFRDRGDRCGCPGTAARELRHDDRPETAGEGPTAEPPSRLGNWPVQLQLLNPQASVFDGADLLVAADCVPFAFAGFHERFLKNRVPIVFCPKLDRVIDQYVAKLAEIFRLHPIRSIAIVRMEVPCCGGVKVVVQRALEAAGKEIPLRETTISLEGGILDEVHP